MVEPTAYEHLFRRASSDEQMKVQSLSSGSDMSDLIILETGSKRMVRRETGRRGVGRSTSRPTASKAAYARVAPSSSPAVIQQMTASQGGVRKQSPSSSSTSDPSKFRCVRREPMVSSTEWIGPGPEKAVQTFRNSAIPHSILKCHHMFVPHVRVIHHRVWYPRYGLTNLHVHCQIRQV